MSRSQGSKQSGRSNISRSQQSGRGISGTLGSYSRSSFSGSALSQSAILYKDCRALPLQIYATIGGGACSGMTGTVVTLVYNLINETWEGTASLCAGLISITLTCDTTPGITNLKDRLSISFSTYLLNL